MNRRVERQAGLHGHLHRRRWLGAAAGLVCALLVACAQFSPPTRWTLDEAELQTLLERQFPLDQRLLDLFEVRATQPRLRLLPQRNRLQAVLDVQLRERLLATQFKGQLDFDAALRWHAADQTVRLDQVRVQDFVLLDAPALGAPGASPAGAPGTRTAATAQRRSGTERVAAALAERMLEGRVLYRVPAEKQAQLDKAGVQLASLAITRHGLEITFAPTAK